MISNRSCKHLGRVLFKSNISNLFGIGYLYSHFRHTTVVGNHAAKKYIRLLFPDVDHSQGAVLSANIYHGYMSALIPVGIVLPQGHVLNGSACTYATRTYEAAVSLVTTHVWHIQTGFACLTKSVIVTYTIVIYLNGVTEEG